MKKTTLDHKIATAKAVWNRYNASKAATYAIEALWDADPTDETLEAAWDNAYKAEHAELMTLQHIVIELVAIGGETIDASTARAMIHSEKFDDLMKRWAA